MKWTKVRGLQEYRFSIVIENSLSEGRYFTEKLLDALAVGTIPIYWGTDFAVRVFGGAVIPFRNVHEALRLVQSLKADRYEALRPELLRAQPIARWFASPENFLWKYVYGCSLPDHDKFLDRFVAGLSDVVERELDDSH